MGGNSSLFTDKDEKEIIPYLNEGQVILFLGAGFSAEVKNMSGENIPSAFDLARKMAGILKYSGVPGFDKTNIDSLKLVAENFYQFYKDSPQEINNFFKRHMTVNDNELPYDYYFLKKVNWNGIYTTNYDNLLEVIYRSDKQGIVNYNKVTYKKDDSDLPKEDEFNIVYLNGDLNCKARIEKERVVTDIICSTSDYETSEIPPIWRCFVDKFRQYPIIIIGSRFDEYSFEAIVGELLNRTNIDFSQRPKSYIITPEMSEQQPPAFENKYNIKPVLGTTKMFLKWLADKSDLINSKATIQRGNISSIKKGAGSYIEFTKEYWEGLRGIKPREELVKYYTNINSSSYLLPYVIAEELYVEPNEEIDVKNVAPEYGPVRIRLNSKFPKDTGNQNCIIWLNANGGMGKSTLLYHIGKKYCDQYHIIFFKELAETAPVLPQYDNDNKQVIILVDNYGRQIEKLKELSRILNELYFKRGYCLIAAERHIQNSISIKDDKREVDENYLDKINGTLKHNAEFYEKVLNRVVQVVDNENKLFKNGKNSLKDKFISGNKATTAERIIELLITIKHSGLFTEFSFDWEDWKKLCVGNIVFKDYLNLYSIVAAFNKYGIMPKIKFCIDLLGINDINLVSTYSHFTEFADDIPISIQNDDCFELRNPNLAKWYMAEHDRHGTLTKKYFNDAIRECISHEQMYLLRNIYRNEEALKEEDIRSLIPSDEMLLKYFDDYIKTNPNDKDNPKNKMEMVVINCRQNNIVAAKDILYKMIEENDYDVFARTKLAVILIQENNYSEADPIIRYLLEKEPTNNYIIKLAITVFSQFSNKIDVINRLIADLKKDNIANLKYLYAKLEKEHRLAGNYIEAEELCNKLLELNPSDYAAMNALAVIYKDQPEPNYEKAEKILIKTIDIEPNNPHSYNELGQLYAIYYYNTKNAEYKYKALKIFIKGLKLDNKNIPLRTEFARFLRTYCNRMECAKKILINNIQEEPKHMHSYSELGLLYYNQKKFKEAKIILEKGAGYMPVGKEKQKCIPLLVALGRVYLEIDEYEKAEKIFKDTIELNSRNWISYLCIAIAYIKLHKNAEYINVYNKILTELKDANLLSDFAFMLRNNNLIEESIGVMAKAKEFCTDKQMLSINANYADLLLDKIMSAKHSETWKYYMYIGKLDKICQDNLAIKQDHEKTLHILYRLYWHLHNQTYENIQLRNTYSKKYKEYLSKMYMGDRTSYYLLDPIALHLRKIHRYRLGIEYVKKYEGIKQTLPIYVGNLLAIYNCLQNRHEIVLLFDIAEKNKIRPPSIKLNPDVELVSQDNIGFLLDGEIKHKDTMYKINKKTVSISRKAIQLSRQSSKGIKVFFGLYKYRGEIVADFIEPYFESIPDDSTALDLLELVPSSVF